MRMKLGALVLAAGALATAAYGSGLAKTAAAPKVVAVPTVNESMTHVMSVEAQTIWDISSKAFNAKGDGLDARKLTASDWRRLGDAGRRLKERATLLAKADRVIAAVPGEHIMGEEASHGGVKKTWDAANAQQIQALIDAKPKQFTQRAWTLVRTGETLEKAAKTKDVGAVYRVSADLDEVCDGCHKPFWGTDEPPPPPTNVPVILGR